MPGEWSILHPGDEKAQQVIDAVRAEVEKRLKEALPLYKAIVYRNQIVNGMNYRVVTQIGSNEFIEITVHEELPCNGGKCTLIDVEPVLMAAFEEMPIFDGWTGMLPPDANAQKVIDAVRKEVEKKLGRHLPMYNAVKYQYQIVAGTNYRVKTQIGENEFIIIILFQDLSWNGGKCTLKGIEKAHEIIPGGWSDWMAGDEKAKKAIDAVRAEVEKKLGRHVPMYRAVEYQEQVVGGTNYRVKTKIGNYELITIAVFEALNGGGYTFTSIEEVNLVKVGGKQLPGGWSPLGPADANAKRVIDLVKDQVEKKLGQKLPVYNALAYQTQIVAGINYRVLANIGVGEPSKLVFLDVFEKLPFESGICILTDIEKIEF